jgi:hypothetical protein
MVSLLNLAGQTVRSGDGERMAETSAKILAVSKIGQSIPKPEKLIETGRLHVPESIRRHGYGAPT